MGMGMGMVGNVQVVALSVTSILLVGILASPAAAAAAEERGMVKYSSCNGTIAECFGNELEMVMDSDMSRRFLQGGKGSVTSLSLNQFKSVGPNCGRYTGNSCLPPPNPKTALRQCKLYDRCNRNPNA